MALRQSESWAPDISLQSAPVEPPSDRLLCAACRHWLTQERMRVTVAGSVTHDATNPHGVTYHFACFREARGCRISGEPTAEFSWFTGCRWQLANCAGCGRHLGWYFTGQATFFGLILALLASE